MSALLAVCFHASVNRRFSLMENGLKMAATIRYAMEWDELMELEYHNEAYQDNRESLRHLMLALEYAHEAHLLHENITKDRTEIQDLEGDAEEEKKKAEEDEKEASLWALRAFGDGRASVGAGLSGVELAKKAQDENERAQAALQHANQTLTEGTAKLHQAHESLQLAKEAKNHTTLDKGVCRWMSLACDIIRGQPTVNSSYPANPNDLAIQANKDIQDALQEIQDANTEKDWGMELLVNASAHANLSTDILQDAKMFRSQAIIDRDQAHKYRTQEVEDEKEYDKDEIFITEDRNEITADRKRMYNYTNTSRSFLEMAISDRVEFRHAVEQYQSSRTRAADMEKLLIQKTVEAKQHVSKAGWSALAACVAGACLLVTVAVQIVATFRYQRPIQWIVKGPPDTAHDLLYLVNHIFIFFLSIGYVGELLLDFGHEKKVTRTATVFLFSILGAVLQVSLLHFLPHICKMLQTSSILDWSSSQVLIREDIVKKGSLVSIVFACEMLLMWVNIGTVAFTGAYRLNNWWCWIMVVSLAGCYTSFLLKTDWLDRRMDVSEYLDVFDTVTVESNPLSYEERSRNSVDNQEEKVSLLAQSSLRGSLSESMRDSASDYVETSAQGSIMNSASPAYSKSDQRSSSSSSMRSVPLGNAEASGYGATDQIQTMILPEIRATFVRSWTSELRKTLLLVEILVVSWAVWIIRRNIILIFKLSPLVKGIAWGRCPLWILNIFFFVALAVFAMSYNRKR